jgi:hypothetical protein
MGLPHARQGRATPEEVAAWRAHVAANRRAAAGHGWSLADTLRILHDPRWSWTPGFFGSA